MRVFDRGRRLKQKDEHGHDRHETRSRPLIGGLQRPAADHTFLAGGTRAFCCM
jgi:hypothetical protein